MNRRLRRVRRALLRQDSAAGEALRAVAAARQALQGGADVEVPVALVAFEVGAVESLERTPTVDTMKGGFNPAKGKRR